MGNALCSGVPEYGSSVYPDPKGYRCEGVALNAWSYNGFTAEQKGFEAASSKRAGADGVQTMVMTTELKSGHLDNIDAEMHAVREALPNGIVQFCLEMEYLNDQELENACKLAVKNKIDH